MEVLVHPNPNLGQRAEKVDCATDTSLVELATEMGRAMYEAHGVGLAATQLGVMKRVIVYDLSEHDDELIALCNPEIVAYSDEREADEEGCLSLPGISVLVERPVAVTCEATLLDGRQVRIEADGLRARLLQHETDHLDGIIILDRATHEERKAALRRYREAVEKGAKPGETSI